MEEHRQFGIRVDNVDLLERLFNGKWNPRNYIDKAIYCEMCKWMDYFENPSIDYIYFGNEFCDKKITSIEEWREVISFCHKYNKTLVITLPSCREDSENVQLRNTRMLFDDLSRINFEIEVNDYGMLHTIKTDVLLNSITSIRVGRVLDKSFHDYRISDNELENVLIDNTGDAYIDENWCSLSTLKVFDEFNVTGMDLDIPTIAAMCKRKKKIKDLSVGVFVPYSYTTTGGVCQMKSIGLEDKFGTYNEKCQEKCLEYYEILRRQMINQKNVYKDAWRVGNTIFYLRDCDIDTVASADGIDRIIFEPKLMI